MSMRMASGGDRRPTKHDPSSLVDEINKLNIFGRCTRDDLEFRGDEEKEKERKFNEERRIKEEEIKKQEEKRQKEEEAFENYLRKQTERMVTKNTRTYSSLHVGVGRARFIDNNFSQPNDRKPGNPRTAQDQGCLPFFEREERVKNNIKQFCGDSGFHSHSVQREFWVRKSTDGVEDEESDDHLFSASDSTNSDQYEDVESSASLPYISAPSDASDSPTVSAPSPCLDPPPHALGATRSPRKPRRSRLAARFTNSIDDEIYERGEEKEREGEDPLAILGSSQPPAVPVKYTASHRIATGTSFNSIRPSQRVLRNDILRPEDFYVNSAAPFTSATEEFSFKGEDFPPL